MYEIDQTHDAGLESWVESANDPATDFPIQNLPWCMFASADDGPEGLRPGVRIGDSLVSIESCLSAAERSGAAVGLLGDAVDTEQVDLSDPGVRAGIRRVVSHMLAREQEGLLGEMPLLADEALVAPLFGPWGISEIGDYTDFYTSVHHATNVGSMFRPNQPLMPNYKWLPVGYHGRASSLVASGEPVVRPSGQRAPAEEGGVPTFGPSKLLDYEMEVGVFLASGNSMGQPIGVDEAEAHMLGLCLVNDWSARDIQKWEYQPLGPFLAKSFATTLSPYIVTMEALAPFRCPAFTRAEGDPKPLPHLFSERDQSMGGVDMTVEVLLASEAMREQGMTPLRLSIGNFRQMYWTIAQMLTHHASNGCPMQPGDLLASGTVSGPERGSRGCLLELTWDGDASNPVPGTQRTPIELPTGETRLFLEDGDEVIMRGWCEREGYRRIGFGECTGVVAAAPTLAT